MAAINPQIRRVDADVVRWHEQTRTTCSHPGCTSLPTHMASYIYDSGRARVDCRPGRDLRRERRMRFCDVHASEFCRKYGVQTEESASTPRNEGEAS
jgi:hypothetical protein